MNPVDVPFETIAGPELAATHNQDEEDHRQDITLRELGECRIRAELKNVHYGRCKGNEAALIIIAFNFVKSPKIRYKSANIRIAFDRLSPIQANRTSVPTVTDFFPCAVYGSVTEDKKRWNWNASFGLSGLAASPIQPTGQLGVASESEFVVGHRLEILGDKYSNRINHRPNNVVEWKLTENDAQLSGLPHTFFCATIVEHHGAAFNAEVTVKVTTGVRKWYDPIAGSQGWIMQAWPWERDDPIKFNPTINSESLHIPRLADKDMVCLSEEDRKKLTPFVTDYEVTAPLYEFNI